MNNITPEQKQPVIKTLALAGLVGVIILIAWLAVQIVNIFPSALSSLASIAGSVYTYNPLETIELNLHTSATLVNSGQPFSISWTKSNNRGTYAFSYACNQDTVSSINLSTSGNNFSSLECEKKYDLGSVESINLSIITKNERFTDVGYTIHFYRSNSTSSTISQSATTTIVNASIAIETEISTTTKPITPEVAGVATTTPAVATTSPDVKPPVTTVVPVATTTPNIVTKPTNTKPTKPVETFVDSNPVYIYELPVSNPKGTPDLAVVYLGVGTLKSGVFSKTNTIKAGEIGAIQFSVHNIGNKTSEVWSYQAKLPGDYNYQSGIERTLLPNERAVLTIQFPAVTSSRLENFSVVVNTKTDANTGNNAFKASALVSK